MTNLKSIPPGSETSNDISSENTNNMPTCNIPTDLQSCYESLEPDISNSKTTISVFDSIPDKIDHN